MAAPIGYVVAMVMARPSPIARVLSKNTESPTAMAATIEILRNANVVHDIATSVPGPSLTLTQAASSVPAMPERTALIVTEP